MSVEYYSIIPHGYYLTHYGVKEKSGRYDWGSGDRPYQRLEKARGPGFFARRKEKKKQAAILLEKKKQLEERRKQEEERARLKADKERVMREGTATEIKQYLPELSNAELQAACERIKWMNTLNSFTELEAKKAAGKNTFNQIDDFMNKLAKVNKWGETSIKTYENTKKILDTIKASADKAAKENKKKG